ncbi:MAG: PadR family transcriptional regulator [Candidatus Dormibacteria bacterium]
MQALSRITQAMLDVLTILVQAPDDPHGFAIAKAAKHPTGSVYPILARLEDAGWVESHWETEHPHEGRPRRRFYRLTSPEGLRAARTLLEERRVKQAKRPYQLWVGVFSPSRQ